MNCLWTTCPPVDLNMLILLSITKWLLWSPRMTLMDFTNSSFNSFFAPSCSEYFFVFLLRVHCIAPKRSTFQGVLRSVDFILVKDFANSIDILLVWQSFLFWNQISYFKDHVYSKSSCWNKIREISVLEKIFWKSSFFDQRSNTHYSM